MTGRIAFGGLGLAALALAGLVALELTWFEDEDRRTITAEATPPPRRRPLPVALPSPAGDLLGEWGDTALRRPIFAPDRRPEPEQWRAAAAARGGDLPRLAGVVVQPAGRIAIFAAKEEGGAPTVVREGESLGPYEVRTILIGQVTVVGPNGEHVLRPNHSPPARPSNPGFNASASTVVPSTPAAAMPLAGQTAGPPILVESGLPQD